MASGRWCQRDLRAKGKEEELGKERCVDGAGTVTNLLGILVSAVLSLVAQRSGAADFQVGFRGGYLAIAFTEANYPDRRIDMPLVGIHAGVGLGDHWRITTMGLWGYKRVKSTEWFMECGLPRPFDNYYPTGTQPDPNPIERELIYNRGIVAVGGDFRSGMFDDWRPSPFFSLGFGVDSLFRMRRTTRAVNSDFRGTLYFGGGVESKVSKRISVFISALCLSGSHGFGDLEGPYLHGGTSFGL